MRNQKQEASDIDILPISGSWIIGRKTGWKPRFKGLVLLGLLLLVSAQAQETNSLGMKMVPGASILMATTEVKVDQHNATGLEYESPKFSQGGNPSGGRELEESYNNPRENFRRSRLLYALMKAKA